MSLILTLDIVSIVIALASLVFLVIIYLKILRTSYFKAPLLVLITMISLFAISQYIHIFDVKDNINLTLENVRIFLLISGFLLVIFLFYLLNNISNNFGFNNTNYAKRARLETIRCEKCKMVYKYNTPGEKLYSLGLIDDSGRPLVPLKDIIEKKYIEHKHKR